MSLMARRQRAAEANVVWTEASSPSRPVSAPARTRAPPSPRRRDRRWRRGCPPTIHRGWPPTGSYRPDQVPRGRGRPPHRGPDRLEQRQATICGRWLACAISRSARRVEHRRRRAERRDKARRRSRRTARCAPTASGSTAGPGTGARAPTRSPTSRRPRADGRRRTDQTVRLGGRHDAALRAADVVTTASGPAAARRGQRGHVHGHRRAQDHQIGRRRDTSPAVSVTAPESHHAHQHIAQSMRGRGCAATSPAPPTPPIRR